MYTDKKNILQLAALTKAHGIRQFVLCPGSRDIPIVQTLASIPEFTCYSVTDERSAGFFALGLALNGGEPAAVCCTSGSALLNLHPAVSEAFYQQVPLVVISADRPGAWIGQMDGQTLPQPGIFGSLVKKSVNLPEIKDEEDEWYCNRLLNEALLELNHHGKGPVHINIPISRPLFNFTTDEIPEVRVIRRYDDDESLLAFSESFHRHQRRMAIAGQMNPTCIPEHSTARCLEPHFVWIAENTSNQTGTRTAVRHIEQLLASMDKETQERMRPNLLVTYGGHIISGRLKNYLRHYPPTEHWHISQDGQIADVFQSLTAVIEMDPYEFFLKIAPLLGNAMSDYPHQWTRLAQSVQEPVFQFSEMSAIGETIHRLPSPCVLHLGNSSVVRYAQLFNLPDKTDVLSNRGTNGIEGSLSTALGYATSSKKLNFIFIGDLSFFYDMNALWNSNFGNNVRILLLNNGGGEIFHALPGLEIKPVTSRFVIAGHKTSAHGWAEERGFIYLSACNEEEFGKAVSTFTSPQAFSSPMLFEVFTDKNTDAELLKMYYNNLKK